MAIVRKYIVPTHAITQASSANSRRIVGMATLIDATRNGRINEVDVETMRMIYLFTSVVESSLISADNPVSKNVHYRNFLRKFRWYVCISIDRGAI